MGRDTFSNPATGETYQWEVNHSDEESLGKQRNITRTAPTGNIGTVRQQGEDGPFQMKYSGEILTRHQYQQMWHWFEMSRAQTIYFTDFDGNAYEVQIVDFEPKRVRTINNRRDPGMSHNYFTYDIVMDIFRVISGDLAGVAP